MGTGQAPLFLAISDGHWPETGFDAWLDGLAGAWAAVSPGAPGTPGTPNVPLLAVQVREKHLDDERLLALLCAARQRLPAAIPVLANSRVEMALAAGVDGVHLPAAGPAVAAARRTAASQGRGILVGRSTHSLEEVTAARAEGADYATFGPVFATPSKADYGPPPGVDTLRRAVEGVARGLPLLALGGVTAERLPELAAAGARGGAAIRAFADRAGTAAMLRAAALFTGHAHSARRGDAPADM